MLCITIISKLDLFDVFFFAYIQSLNKECHLFFLLVISRVWAKSEFCWLFWLYPEPERRVSFCCLFWLYPEPERRVGFVVCFGYIQKQTTNDTLSSGSGYKQNKQQKLTLRSGSWYNQNKQQNSLFAQTLDITKWNNKWHSLFRLWI
jgi:hypothetical protein